MSATDKIRNKTEQLSGELKRKVGGATGNRELQIEGIFQKARADLRQVAKKGQQRLQALSHRAR